MRLRNLDFLEKALTPFHAYVAQCRSPSLSKEIVRRSNRQWAVRTWRSLPRRPNVHGPSLTWKMVRNGLGKTELMMFMELEPARFDARRAQGGMVSQAGVLILRSNSWIRAITSSNSGHRSHNHP